MIKTVKKYGMLSILFFNCFTALQADEKIYIDSQDLNMEQDAFRIHMGHNVWIKSNSVHRDKTGLFTFESDIIRSLDGKSYEAGYQKEWKCPYCHRYWPMGTPCQNPDCPSRYR